MTDKRNDNHLKVIGDYISILNECGIEFWLDYGSLLGMVREGKLLEWDNDVDFSTLIYYINNKVELLENKLLENEFCVYKRYVDGKIFGIESVKYGESIDLYIFHIDGDNAIRYQLMPANFIGKIIHCLKWASRVSSPDEVAVNASTATKILVHITSLFPYLIKKLLTAIFQDIEQKLGGEKVIFSVPKHFYENLDTIDFFGIPIKIPEKSEEYLELCYGTDWRIPKKEWYWARDSEFVRNRQ